MLEDALGSRSKVRLLRALCQRPGRSVSTDELVAVTGQSTGTLVPALQQLVASGILATRLEGRSRTYTLVDEHAVVPLLRRLFDEETRLLDRLCDGIARRAVGGGLRFGAWAHREGVLLLLIADDPVRTRALAEEAAKESLQLELRVLSVEEARAQLDGDLAAIVEEGRVVFADESWLRG